MGFSRPEYWSGWPCPPPRDLPDPAIEPASLISPALAAGSLAREALGKPGILRSLKVQHAIDVEQVPRKYLDEGANDRPGWRDVILQPA